MLLSAVLLVIVIFAKSGVVKNRLTQPQKQHSVLESANYRDDKTRSQKILSDLKAYDLSVGLSLAANREYAGLYDFHPEVRSLFIRAKDFFDGVPGGIAAARFISLISVARGDQPFNEIMKSCQMQMRANSGAILQRLKTIDRPLEADALMDEALMNVAMQIDVPESEKLALLARVAKQKFEADQQGQLTPNSLNAETAFVMMQTLDRNPQNVLPYVVQTLRLNSDPESKSLLKTRVSALYPQLVYLMN